MAERRRQGYASSLLHRADRMLDELELLNMHNARQVPLSWQQQIASLVPDLPFEYPLANIGLPTPTQAIDLVFDLQQALLLWITGREAEEEELETSN